MSTLLKGANIGLDTGSIVSPALKATNELMKSVVNQEKIKKQAPEIYTSLTLGTEKIKTRSEQIGEEVDKFFRDTPVSQKVAWDKAYKATEPSDISGYQGSFFGSLAYPLLKANEAMKESLRSSMNSLSIYRQLMEEGIKTVDVNGSKVDIRWEMTKAGIIPAFLPFEGIISLLPAADFVVEKGFEGLAHGISWFQNKYATAHSVRAEREIEMLSQPGFYLDPNNPDYENRLKFIEDRQHRSKVIGNTAIDIVANIATFYAMAKFGKKLGDKMKLQENQVRESGISTQVKDVIFGEFEKIKEKIKFEEGFVPKKEIELAIREGYEMYERQKAGLPIEMPTRLQQVISRIKSNLLEGEKIKTEIVNGVEGLNLRVRKRDFVKWAKDFVKEWFPKETMTEEMKALVEINPNKNINKNYELANQALNWGVGESRLAYFDKGIVKGVRPGIEKAAPIETELQQSIQKAKASGQSFDEWVKGQGEAISQFTEKGKEGKFWTTPEGADIGYGKIRNEASIDTSKLYKGTSSYDFVKEKGLLTKDLQAKLDATELSNDPNQFYKITQDIAESELKKEGYSGVKWSYEDDLNPTQYQVWDKKVIKTRSQLKAEWDKTLPTETLKTDRNIGIGGDKKLTPEELAGRGEKTFNTELYEDEVKVSFDIDMANEKMKKIREGDYDRIKEVKKLPQDLDVESARKNNPELEKLIESVKEDFNIESDDLAYEFIRDFPTKSDISEMRKEKSRLGAEIKEMEQKKKTRDMESRRKRLKAVRDFFALSDSDLKKINKRDFRLMGEVEYENFLNDIRRKAFQYVKTQEAKTRVLETITNNQYQKVDNLRKAMKLPPLEKMTIAQLKQYADILDQYKEGDVFLSQRKLETVDRTDLAGIKTMREAREKLAEQLGIQVKDLEDIKASWTDKFRWDTALAEKNPFYKLLVEDFAKNSIEHDSYYLQIKKDFIGLVNKANKSKKRGVVDRLIPQNETVVKYLEADEQGKTLIAKDMTAEEIDLAGYMQLYYSDSLDYLVKVEALGAGIDDYYTHIRRGFLETVREDGLIKAFSEVFQQYKDDRMSFKILDEDTGNILPLEKFFQFAMRRTGEIEPSKNITKTFLAYVKMLETKKALDKTIPKLDIYAHSLTPQHYTPLGLETDRSLVTFVKEWVNNKKGRRTNFLKIPQGSPAEIMIRGLKIFTSLMDLGLNLGVSIASQVGEQVTNFQMIGTKDYVKGVARSNTKKGKGIISKYRNFIGENPWKELVEPGKNISERLMEGLFILFRDSSVRANKVFLLGSMTKEEYASGKISEERLAELRTIMGRYRVVPEGKSIVGSTAAGGAFTQYRTWALPILRTSLKNITKMKDVVIPSRTKDTIKSREFKEFVRMLGITGFVLMIGNALVDSEDDSFLGTIKQKVYREALTLLGGVDWTTFLATPRIYSFVQDVGKSLKELVLLEEYSEQYKKQEDLEGLDELKGYRHLKRNFTPHILKQLQKTFEIEKPSSSSKKKLKK